MQVNRKNKLISEYSQKRSHSSKSILGKGKHILAKPIKPRSSSKMHAHSHSTMISPTHSKSPSMKLSSTFAHIPTSKKEQQPSIIKQMSSTIKRLKKVQKIRKNGQTNTEWNKQVTQIKQKIQNKKLKDIIAKIQSGYMNQSTEKRSQNRKLDLEIGKIEKQNIMDYHDQFMGKRDEFSQSWRDMLKLQKTFEVL